MKQLKITLNGKTVRTYRNDLHNSLSPKYHKPRQRPGYKAKYFNQMSNNKGLLAALGITMFLGTSILVGCSMRVDGYKAEIGALQHELERTMDIAAGNVDSYNQLESELASCSAKLPQPKVSKGKVSFYSKDGCLGCSANQTMANGQIFDENAMTLAHNGIPLNTKVKVINQDNGLFAYATITDRGGFEKYGRMADLSKGLYEAIGAKTDVSNIQITWY